MLHAYIDESGDEGKGATSSAWLLLGCVVLSASDINGAKQYLHEGVCRVWKNQKVPRHVHFNKVTSHSQKKALLNMLTGLNFISCIVALQKSGLPTNLKSPRIYNYVAKHILERLSWLAKDRNQKIHITFAERNESTWNELEEYIELLRHRDDHQIKFDYIDVITHAPAAQNILVQSADWIVSAFGCGLNPDGYGDTEACYVELLWGKFWMRSGKVWSYGLKALPATVDRKKIKLFRKIDAWLEDPTTIVR